MKLKDYNKLNIAFLPTPLQRVNRLAKKIGLNELYIKRDDQTGLALGGNKVRKLEYLLADAKKKGANTVLTVGGPQSNHCRMTAAAARACGMKCSLIFGGEEIIEEQGNMILDKLLKADWHFSEGLERDEKMAQVAKQIEKNGEKTYQIPLGGSNAIGALGYVEAGIELATQCKEQGISPDYIICASGSGGTQAGLIVGCCLGGLKSKIIGVSVSGTKLELEEIITNLVEQLSGMLEFNKEGLSEVIVMDEFVGEGYGRPTELSHKSLQLLAEEEGIIIDPVYTAKGFSGLLGMLDDGRINKNSKVVFIHTGGMPALFADTDLYWKPNVDIGKQ